MAFRGKRRKATVIWLPSVNASNSGAPQGPTAVQGTIPVPRIGDLSAANTHTTIFALTADYGPDVQATPSMADYEASGFRLRRIVGKFFAAMRQVDDETNGATAAGLLGAGLIILRVDSSGTPLEGGSPNHYSPLLTPNERDPWIWRRTWILANGAAGHVGLSTGASGYAFIDGPFNNYELAASSVDSAHVDQKTARRVGPEERVFLVVSAQQPINTTFSSEGAIDFVFDYRMVASPTKAYGNRRNASR